MMRKISLSLSISSLLLLTVIAEKSYCKDFTEEDPACDTMVPTFNENMISSAERSEFKIRVFTENGSETFEYDSMTLEPLNVKIQGGPFEKAHIQARSIVVPAVQVGRFLSPSSKYFKLVNCSGVYGGAIINDNLIARRHGKLRWEPPRVTVGPIVFLASVIHSKRLVHIRSAFLSPHNSQIHFDNTGCGHTYGCLKMGNTSCVFGYSCSFSIKWRCYKRSVIIEGVQGQRTAAFGFSYNGSRAVLCVSRPEQSRTGDFVITQDRGFPSVPARFRGRGLKVIEENNRVYCRFEMDRPKFGKTVFLYGKVDAYGHPYKLRQWWLPEWTMCDPKSFSSTTQLKRYPSRDLESSASFTWPPLLNFICLFILPHILPLM